MPAGETSFDFANDLASGSVYAVTVATQPTNPSQSCTVTSGGSGTVTNGAVTSIAVTCTTNTYQVGGEVSGLTGTGLTLATAGESNLTVPAGATNFDFATSLAQRDGLRGVGGNPALESFADVRRDEWQRHGDERLDILEHRGDLHDQHVRGRRNGLGPDRHGADAGHGGRAQPDSARGGE